MDSSTNSSRLASRGIPIPHSTVAAEVKGRVEAELELVTFYCGEHGHRLFDYRSHLTWENYYEDLYAVVKRGGVVEKLCPRCKLLNTRPITTRRGVKVGESGRWTCEGCGAFLAVVDAIRGRLTLRCRCGEQHAAVPEALLTVEPPPGRCDPDGNTIADVPLDDI